MHNQHLFKSPAIGIYYIRPLKVTTNLTEDAPLIFLQYWVEKLMILPRIEPTTLDPSSQSGAYDLFVTEDPFILKIFIFL